MTHQPTSQLGFDSLLNNAETDNRLRQFMQKTAHLPDTMADAIPYYRVLLRQHHAAMLAADIDEAMRLREEAGDLALKLNKSEPGILASDGAPGCVLRDRTAAANGAVPLWGQAGDFIVDCETVKVRIEMNGIFGIGGRCLYWPGFAAHAVDYHRPFISHTGYRSFLGIHAEPEPNLSVDDFIRKVIAAYWANDLKGKLEMIDERYRKEAA